MKTKIEEDWDALMQPDGSDAVVQLADVAPYAVEPSGEYDFVTTDFEGSMGHPPLSDVTAATPVTSETSHVAPPPVAPPPHKLFLAIQPPLEGIKNIQQLREHLEWAIMLEHCTIPPYLCALYSLKDGYNQPSAEILRSVVMEEMLHMALAANLLNAVGGQPRINARGFIPNYPTYLPKITAFKVSLLPFCEESVKAFTRIELPEEEASSLPNNSHTLPQEVYNTIGQFYRAIEKGLRKICEEEDPFTGDPARQITSEAYYGGGGELFAVTDLASALKAIQEIMDQGEGSNGSIDDKDDTVFQQEREAAHYYRYKQIRDQRYLSPTDTPKTAPSGKPFEVHYSPEAVYPMQPNPRADSYPMGSEIRAHLDQFNTTYMQLLDALHWAFNGCPERLANAANIMFTLKYQAVALMKVPSPDSAYTVGPSFEYQE